MKAWKTPLRKSENLFTNSSLIFEFQICIVKLLAYNALIILVIANQNSEWIYTLTDLDTANRFVRELTDPLILPKFGFSFRFLTVIMNILAIFTLIQPNRDRRKYLLPCIIWNFYTLMAIAENILEIAWIMIKLHIPFSIFATTHVVSMFMLAFQSKLTLQALRFYEYLNYMPNAYAPFVYFKT
uniref:Uncharacterized protein n=1 Tax=Glossina brevipalpis TaxID=37001 RepID=A0A1A9WBB0_9MUSC